MKLGMWNVGSLTGRKRKLIDILKIQKKDECTYWLCARYKVEMREIKLN